MMNVCYNDTGGWEPTTRAPLRLQHHEYRLLSIKVYQSKGELELRVVNDERFPPSRGI
jgi:hypothetical protein